MSFKIRHFLRPMTTLYMALSLVFVSCEDSNKVTVDPDIAVKTNPVSNTAGSQFMSVTADGDWTVTADASWVSFNPDHGTDSRTSVVLSWESNGSEEGRSTLLTLYNSGRTDTLRLSQAGKSSTVTPPTPDVDPDPTPGPAPVSTGWLELPATDGDANCAFFSHNMKVGSTATRNYSFYWDYDNLVAKWVAYPLCAWNIGSSVKRTDAWGLDPLLPRDKQPVLFNAFMEGNAGWHARGHQIPSADRLTSYSSNSMTFYFTNMTPQIQNGFNGDIWANLENKVRSWANKSDTLYVVTGCVPEGSSKYCYDNDGKKVTVPVAYYKAVLRYSKSSTFGHDGFMGCAVWLDHKAYSNSSVSSQYSMSIADLEKKLGYELFVNLPDRVGEAQSKVIKEENPASVSWWW